jgi:hypothetical protein
MTITNEALSAQIDGLKDIVELGRAEHSRELVQICDQLTAMNGRQREHRGDISANRESISVIQQRHNQLAKDLNRSVNVKVIGGWILSLLQAAGAFFASSQ